MTGYPSKKASAQDKLNDDDDTQVYGDALTIAYQSGYYDGKKAAQPAQEPVSVQKSGIANSPSDPEICNERSAQACGPVYCGDSGGYCNKCPKQKTIQTVKACKGMNCGCTDGRSHSLECLAELAAAIAGGVFVQEVLAKQPAQPAQEPVAWWNNMGTHIDLNVSGRGIPLYTTPPQRTWVEPTGNEWFEWWRVSAIADSTEAEIDFSDFFIIAQAVIDKLKETNK
jgi:hypothetical protein